MFVINYQSREPIYEQLYKNVVRLVSLGAMEPEQQLPPVRQLATELGVNPNTVSKAYKNLEKDGIIYSVVGKGSFIMKNSNVANSKKSEAISNLETAVKSAVEVGVTQDEIMKITQDIYRGSGDK